jgi:hypothetical protein
MSAAVCFCVIVKISNGVNIRAIDAGAGERRTVAVKLQGDHVVHEADGEPVQAAVNEAERLGIILDD